jgi:hypothetical protein
VQCKYLISNRKSIGKSCSMNVLINYYNSFLFTDREKSQLFELNFVQIKN